jgi:hypothetical protein
MDPRTGREFNFTNPQDDPELYPSPPAGFQYDIDGHLIAIPSVSSDSIIGMTVPQAEHTLQKRGLTLRMIMEDGIPFMLTQDFRPDRMNVEVKNGKVVRIDRMG